MSKKDKINSKENNKKIKEINLKVKKPNKEKKPKKKNLQKQNSQILKISIIKLILILIILGGFYYVNSSFKNTISLLAVNENSEGKISGGSLVNLTLKIKPGKGDIFVKLNSIEEVDTQISIINSQKIACDIFKLNCQDYDFYYDFSSSSIILKGPSASSAIAILTAKTVNKEKIKKNEAVITGSLNSGGIIGNVGGVTEKILVAKDKNIKKVLIPLFSSYDETKNYSGIKIIKVMDLVEAYNNFGKNKFVEKTYPINNTKYKILMKTLAENLCNRSQIIKNEINFSLIKENSTLNTYLEKAEKSYNSSRTTYTIGNYYSTGSFCYNANINYRIVLENLNNLTFKNLNKKALELNEEIDFEITNISSTKYKKQLKTINDFYVYLLLNNRINEAKEYINDYGKIKYLLIEDEIKNRENKTFIINNISLTLSEILKINEIINSNKDNNALIRTKIITLIENKTNKNNLSNISSNNNTNFKNISNSTIFKINKAIQNLSNFTSKIKTTIQIENTEIINYTKKINNKKLKTKINYFSSSKERLYTVKLWEKFLSHTGTKVIFDDKKINEICQNINREINIKSELLKKYHLNYLDESITQQNSYDNEGANKYLCIYNGLELNGRINTILNSIGIQNNKSFEFAKKLLEFTKTKLPLNSMGDFPLLPYIYTEYSEDLLKQNDTISTMLYSNYALSYLDLNYLLKDRRIKKSLFNYVITESYQNIYFILGLLLLVSFIGV